jgi:hypothetical protein
MKKSEPATEGGEKRLTDADLLYMIPEELQVKKRLPKETETSGAGTLLHVPLHLHSCSHSRSLVLLVLLALPSHLVFFLFPLEQKPLFLTLLVL